VERQGEKSCQAQKRKKQLTAKGRSQGHDKAKKKKKQLKRFQPKERAENKPPVKNIRGGRRKGENNPPPRKNVKGKRGRGNFYIVRQTAQKGRKTPSSPSIGRGGGVESSD